MNKTERVNNSVGLEEGGPEHTEDSKKQIALKLYLEKSVDCQQDRRRKGTLSRRENI